METEGLEWVKKLPMRRKHATQPPRRYRLHWITEQEVNVGVIIKDVLRRARVKKGQRFSFGGLLTRFLRGHQIDKEVVDYRSRMNGETEEQLQQLNMDYPLSKHSRSLCRVGPGFEKPLDYDDAIDEEHARVESDDDGDNSEMGKLVLPPQTMRTRG
ncbi:hypothetical protein HAX54_012547 [Datura stramonium]|uniref:Uncharacterized protein n=1 Tax=Datura stramonium TaxID=4076 RepID=A0ABS8TLR4_DATST|nr:hypothetical protein [Datura stramonium]